MNVHWPRVLIRLSVILSASTAWAQIVTDGTVGPVTSLSGPEMTVGAELGATRGGNLFHSFQRFDIPTGHRATFTGPDQIRNVVGRVTGGQASNIDGTLRSSVGQADVYLINPSGVVMGPNAQVDVPAALHLSTADELRFSDGSRYSASDPAASTLTLAAPESFGFLSPQPASLTIEGSQLELKPGNTATLTAGDLSLQGTAQRAAKVSAPGGTLRLQAVGSSVGSVPVGAASAAPGNGTLRVDTAQIDTSGEGGGKIEIRAGETTFSRTWLFADNTGSQDANPSIDFRIGGSMRLDQGSYMTADALSAGRAGDALIQVEALEIRDGSVIGSRSTADGSAGHLTLEVAGRLWLLSGSEIDGSTRASGAGAGITISAAALDIEGAGIYSQALAGSRGRAGDVSVTVAEALNLSSGAKIAASTFSEGQAGTVSVKAGRLQLDGSGAPDQFTGIFSNADLGSSGDGGNVSVTVADWLRILNGGMIASNTRSMGDGGTVSVTAGQLLIDDGGFDGFTGVIARATSISNGDAGNVRVTVAGLLDLMNGGEINSSTFAAGNAGDVRVTADELRIDGLESDQFTGIVSLTQSSGRGGRVEVMTRTLSLDGSDSLGGVAIASQANGESSGDAGSVSVDVSDELSIRGGAVIDSSTYAVGDAGPVQVKAGALRIDGAGSSVPTGIKSIAGPGSTGDAGQLSVEVVGLAELVNGAEINSSTFGPGNAGLIRLQAGALRIDPAGSERFTGITVRATPESSGRAGEIEVEVSGWLRLIGGAGIDSITESSGQGGAVRVAADELWIEQAGIDRSTAIASSTSGSGAAGMVRVTADRVLILSATDDSSSDESDYLIGITSQASSGSSGQAGDVILVVDDLLKVVGRHALIDSSTYGMGQAGQVNVLGADIQLLSGGKIGSITNDAGAANRVVVNAENLLIDGSGTPDANTGISSRAAPTATNRAGNVSVDVSGVLELRADGVIDSATFSEGDAGDVVVKAGELRLLGAGSSQFTGITSLTQSSGKAGSVEIVTDLLSLDGTDSLRGVAITSQANGESSGDAGSVSVAVSDQLSIRSGAVIDSSTYAAGDAGPVQVKAGALHIDGAGSSVPTGIRSIAGTGSTGDAGQLSVEVVGLAELVNGAEISSSTFGPGNAGDIYIRAKDLMLMGIDTQIASGADTTASGHVGRIEVSADRISIRNSALMTIDAWQLQPLVGAPTIDSRIQIDAGRLDLDVGLITARALNLPAATIEIQARDIHLTNGSQITTMADQADGGPITISGGRLWLTDSRIATSVVGQTGNGGDIRLVPESLILDGGFIQANTAATGASGGDIWIDTRALIASEGLVEIGGAERQAFSIDSGRNIIQAAAPGGEQGTIEVISPDLDITAALTPLASPFSDPDDLLTDLCRSATGAKASSLIERGAGGLPSAPLAPGSVSFIGARLSRMNTP